MEDSNVGGKFKKYFQKPTSSTNLRVNFKTRRNVTTFEIFILKHSTLQKLYVRVKNYAL